MLQVVVGWTIKSRGLADAFRWAMLFDGRVVVLVVLLIEWLGCNRLACCQPAAESVVLLATAGLLTLVAGTQPGTQHHLHR